MEIAVHLYICFTDDEIGILGSFKLAYVYAALRYFCTLCCVYLIALKIQYILYGGGLHKQVVNIAD